jgi:hypothetical protein
MAALPESVQIAMLQDQRRAAARKDIETAWRTAAKAALVPPRELNAAEQAALLDRINKLFFGREEWLKQRREAQMRINNRAVTLAEETALLAEVDGLLSTNPDFVSNFKYEADVLAQSNEQDKSGMDPAMKGIFSKITGFLGDGPFAFIGMLLEKLFGMIFPMINAFKEMAEKLNPKPTPASLLSEGRLEDANVLLMKQEADLLAKMDGVLSDLAVAQPMVTRNLRTRLANYRTLLSHFEKKDLLEHANVSEQYKRDNLEARNRAFNVFSTKANEILKIHAEEMALQQQIDNIIVLQRKLTAIPAAVTPEGIALAARLAGINAELAQKNAKVATIVTDETAMLQDLHNNVIPTIIPDLNGLRAERNRLGI